MYKPSMHIAAFFLLVTTGMGAYAAEDGKQTYEDSCSSCHDSGKKGAPMLDDMDEWTDRTQLLWSDVQEQHLDDGFLSTTDDDPKKGITAAQMEAATNYMVSIVSKK
jgi:cytochrome c5